MMKKFIFAVFLIFCNLILIKAQETLQIPEEIKKFYVFEGKWNANGSMTMDGKVNKGTMSHTWSKISDGWGMLIDEEINIPAMGKIYLGHNILGYDIGEKLYHLFTIDNFADVHDHKGTMKDKTIFLEFNGLQSDGKKYKEKISLEIVSDNEYKISGEAFTDGNSIYTFEGDFKR